MSAGLRCSGFSPNILIICLYQKRNRLGQTVEVGYSWVFQMRNHETEVEQITSRLPPNYSTSAITRLNVVEGERVCLSLSPNFAFVDERKSKINPIYFVFYLFKIKSNHHLCCCIKAIYVHPKIINDFNNQSQTYLLF